MGWSDGIEKGYIFKALASTPHSIPGYPASASHHPQSKSIPKITMKMKVFVPKLTLSLFAEWRMELSSSLSRHSRCYYSENILTNAGGREGGVRQYEFIYKLF